MVDEIIRGLISSPVESLDQFITGEITNHLFEDRRVPHSGIDLAALNIQRGKSLRVQLLDANVNRTIRRRRVSGKGKFPKRECSYPEITQGTLSLWAVSIRKF